MSSDSASTWLNMVDNNTTNPDSGGANWLPMSSGRLLNVQIFPSAGTAGEAELSVYKMARRFLLFCITISAPELV
jgi:hypothetical protein